MEDAVDIGVERRLELAAMVMRIDELDAIPLHGVDRPSEATGRTDHERLTANRARDLGIATDGGSLRKCHGRQEEQPGLHAVILSRTPSEARRALTNSTGKPMIVEMGCWKSAMMISLPCWIP